MLNAFLTPPTRSFSIVATRLSQCNIINSRGATLGRHSLLLFCFIYLYILYLFYLFLYCFYLLFIINLLLLLIILGFWGVLVFWIQVCLGLGLINVGISMVVGFFVGRFLGVVIILLRQVGVGWKWLKTFSRVDFGGVGCGRAWVSSLPKFFLGKYFQFWKLPPYFCINNMDNVYYPIFLS